MVEHKEMLMYKHNNDNNMSETRTHQISNKFMSNVQSLNEMQAYNFGKHS